MSDDQIGVGASAGVPAQDPDPYSITREIALKALDRRAYGRAELGQYLARKGADEQIIERVLDRFTEVGLIDDAAFAGQWVEQRHRSRKLPRRALIAELRRKGLDSEVIDEAVATIDGDAEAQAAAELAASKVRGLRAQPYDVALRRLVGVLGRRGFSPQLSWQAAKQALADRCEESQNPSDPDLT